MYGRLSGSVLAAGQRSAGDLFSMRDRAVTFAELFFTRFQSVCWPACARPKQCPSLINGRDGLERQPFVRTSLMSFAWSFVVFFSANDALACLPSCLGLHSPLRPPPFCPSPFARTRRRRRRWRLQPPSPLASFRFVLPEYCNVPRKEDGQA